MPRGTKSSKLAKTIELSKSVVDELLKLQEEYQDLMVEIEQYKKIKPAIEALANTVKPTTETPAPLYVSDKEVKDKVKRIKNKITSDTTTETRSENVKQEKTEPDNISSE